MIFLHYLNTILGVHLTLHSFGLLKHQDCANINVEWSTRNINLFFFFVVNQHIRMFSENSAFQFMKQLC